MLKKDILAKTLDELQDSTVFKFRDGKKSKIYTGKQLKNKPSLVTWLWYDDSDSFLPMKVMENGLADLYEVEKDGS